MTDFPDDKWQQADDPLTALLAQWPVDEAWQGIIQRQMLRALTEGSEEGLDRDIFGKALLNHAVAWMLRSPTRPSPIAMAERLRELADAVEATVTG